MAEMDVGRATAAVTAAPGRPARPSRRAILARLGLLVGIMAVVFVVILPRVVDYGAVVTALTALTLRELAALAGATALAYVANAAPSRLMIPGLSWPHAIGSDLAGRAVVSIIPGPTDIATRFVLYRQWAIPADVATAGIVFYAFFETLADLALPLLATVGVLVAGHAPRPAVFWLSIASAAILAVALAILVAIVRSESTAARLGRGLDAIARRVWHLVRRPPPDGIADGVMDIRERAHETLSSRGSAGFGAAVLAKLAWFLVLQVALWSVGVPSEALAPSAVLTTMAVVALVSLIPITPGAIGVSEVAYIGLLSAAASPGMAGPITAAVLLFRVGEWLIPIPLGWVLLVVMRGRHWRELEANGAAQTETATAS